MIEKKPFNIEIGKRIRGAREKASMSREKLAELVDITPRFVADIERGSVGVSVPNLKKICEVLHVSSDSILWGNINQISLDDRLKTIDSECIEIIDKIIQNQIELINVARRKVTSN